MEASFTFVFLPNRHSVFRFDVHRTLFRHVPCFVPCVNLRQSAVHTPAAERVGIGFRALEDFLRTDVSCPYIGVCEEEALRSVGLPPCRYALCTYHPVTMEAGAPGSIDYNHGQCQFTEGQMKWKLLSMAPRLMMNKLRYGTCLDIFLTHASPRHIHDKEDPCHKGFECFHDFLKKYEPRYMVHGHIHLYNQNEERVGSYYNTTVVNAYSHHVIEI